MNEFVKSIFVNKNKNNINGVFSIGGNKIFYKILNNSDYEKEKSGYLILKDYYKVPLKYLELEGYENNSNVVCYEYCYKVDKDSGLLVDYFSNNDELNHEYKKILNMYKKIFEKTLTYNRKGNCIILFEDRLNNRLLNNINNFHFNNFDEINIIFNDNKIKLSNQIIYKNVLKYFTKISKSWNIISNADPNDMNICIDGTLFDYTAGGYVPIMCEFAVFVCYNLIQGEYLSLKYNKKAFIHHQKIYKCMNTITFNKDNVMHMPRKIRIDAIISYIDIVIKPILDKIDYENWYADFKNYFAMKLLAVFDFNNMYKNDILISLIYLNIFYNQSFKDINELKKYLKQLYD